MDFMVRTIHQHSTGKRIQEEITTTDLTEAIYHYAHHRNTFFTPIYETTFTIGKGSPWYALPSDNKKVTGSYTVQVIDMHSNHQEEQIYTFTDLYEAVVFYGDMKSKYWNSTLYDVTFNEKEAA
jgi:hypothetical protein